MSNRLDEDKPNESLQAAPAPAPAYVKLSGSLSPDGDPGLQREEEEDEEGFSFNPLRPLRDDDMFPPTLLEQGDIGTSELPRVLSRAEPCHLDGAFPAAMPRTMAGWIQNDRSLYFALELGLGPTLDNFKCY